MSQILYQRIYQHRKTDRTEVVFVLDEADADISRRAEAMFREGNSPISECLAPGREFGIMVVLGVRLIGEASRFVLNSVQYHAVFKLPDEESTDEARRTLMLPPGAHRMLPALQPGQCLFRQSHSWPHAMLAPIDHVPPHRGGRPVYDTHLYVQAKRLADLPEVREALDASIGAASGGVPKRRRESFPRTPAHHSSRHRSNHTGRLPGSTTNGHRPQW